MREILADLVAEQQGLDQFLQSIDYRKWPTATPAAGWTIQDQVSHLASTEELAFQAIDEGAGAVAAVLAEHKTVDSFTEAGVARGREMRPGQVIEWWRHARADVVDALSRMTGKERLGWFAGDMSSKSFATVRLMETWAHGLDIHAAVDSEPVDTTRLRHVAWLGWATLPFAFQNAGEGYDGPIRVELRAPEYQKWVFGPEDSENVVRGEAGDWCRVVVRRADAADTGLVATGDVAARALELAKAYI
ncbi:MAG: maleylpyruvate isomerase family mycothiol-dependent enzyme [Acidimicrobiia bacterium]|nr:maleylpyruvate isomerase family mycothiol-dependent enzyme [Acidimicrobiia bacterium]MBT8218089.1 maleylpyruvate isomerase family mycothiol-dependent enzyme [Acidimicrobiia bacterium]NNF11193.1 maleylpyruvate isomerase family mycothiol-dependent enzyme [Acidimicrobiia bacterium]NNL71010.1 maleylpyruvate isomerase family mycothiol-dependent enzyme [Acidimicrobiia bacterium]